MQNVMHITPNAGHTAPNEGWTMQMTATPRVMMRLEEPPWNPIFIIYY